MTTVEGNPQPILTANVTGSEMDSITLLADVVRINSSFVGSHVKVTCTADNGIAPVATASGYVNFASENSCNYFIILQAIFANYKLNFVKDLILLLL